jgi:Tol biopolymer transport system component
MTLPRLREALTAVCLLQLSVTVDAQAPASASVGGPSQSVSTAAGLSLQTEPAWSPDGTRLLTVAAHDARVDLWVTDLDTGAVTRLTDDDAVESGPDWSPDGRCIAYVSTRSATTAINVKCGEEPPRRLISDASAPRWSPDGKRILCSAQRAGARVLLAVPVDGVAEATPLLPWLATELPYGWLVNWRPDGAHVSVVGFPKTGRLALWIVPLDSKGPLGSPLVDFASAFKDGFGSLTSPTLSAAGDILTVGTTGKGQAHVWRIHLDPRGHSQAGQRESLAEAPADWLTFAVAPRESRIAVAWTSSTTRVWLYPFNVESGAVDVDKGQPVSPANGFSSSPDFSRVGDRLVYSTWLPSAGRQELHVREADGTDRVVVADRDQRYGPRWSPDGTLLAYRWQSAGASEFVVRIMDVQKGTEKDLTSKFPTTRYTPFWWGADGESVLASLAFEAPDQKTAYAIAQMPIGSSDHKAPVIAANNQFQLWQSTVSYDRKWMAFVASPLDNKFCSLMAMPAAGGQWKAITDQLGWDDKPRWSPDGRTIYFLSRRSGEFELWSLPFNAQAGTAAGTPRQLTHLSDPKRHILREVGQLELAISASQLAVPIEELDSRLVVVPVAPAPPGKK